MRRRERERKNKRKNNAPPKVKKTKHHQTLKLSNTFGMEYKVKLWFKFDIFHSAKSVYDKFQLCMLIFLSPVLVPQKKKERKRFIYCQWHYPTDLIGERTVILLLYALLPRIFCHVGFFLTLLLLAVINWTKHNYTKLWKSKDIQLTFFLSFIVLFFILSIWNSLGKMDRESIFICLPWTFQKKKKLFILWLRENG